MNRTIYWSQEQLRSYDLLWFEKDVLAALGGLEIDVAGANTTVVGGAAATQTTIASLTINLTAARIYQQAQMDSSSFGALAADNAVVQQQGYAAAQQVTLSTSGISAGQSRWSLVQAQFSQVDSVRSGDPTGGVLYYYNSSNPSSPFQGPANSGTPNNTVRSGVMVYSVVTGAAATTGSEVPPNPISGWVPLFLIDLSFGQTAITNGQILVAGPSVGTNVPSNYPGAPILAGLLNSHHSGGAGNAPKIKLTSEVQGILPLSNLPASSAPAGGGLTTVQTYPGNPNGHVAGNAGVSGVSAPDTVWNITAGSWWVCTTSGNSASAVWAAFSGAAVASSQIYVGTDTGSANALVATVSPAITSLVTGMNFEITPLHANTSTTVTFNPSGLGAINCFRADGSALVIGDIQPAPGKSVFIYDGTANKMLLIDPDIWISQGSVPFPGLPANGLLASSMAGSSTTAAMTISTGGCSNNLGTQSILSQSSISWAVSNGNNANGYQGGTTLPNSSTIFMYLIWGTAGIASFASTALNTPTLPTGYQYFRVIFPFTTDSSGNPIAFASYEGPGGSIICSLSAVINDVNGATVPTNPRSLLVMSVPLGVQVEWRGRAITSMAGTPGQNTIVTSAGDIDIAPTATGTNSVGDLFASNGGSGSNWGKSPVVTDTAGHLGFRVSGAPAATLLYVFTTGWIYYRRL